MIERLAEVPSGFKARIAGGFYLLTVLTASFAVFVRVRLVVSGDLTATLANIQVHGLLFRLGFAADLVAGGFYIAVTALFYDFLKPVNNRLALPAVLFNLVGCATGAQADQLELLARRYAGPNYGGLTIGLMCFGAGSAVFSYLWLKSRQVPRALAAWGLLSSSLVTAGSFLTFVIFPVLGRYLLSAYLAPILIFEVTIGVWLLFKGLQEATAKVEKFSAAAHGS
jgi:hypothetical protein